jgi:tetratricopeptide (TPR) repeat protein
MRTRPLFLHPAKLFFVQKPVQIPMPTLFNVFGAKSIWRKLASVLFCVFLFACAQQPQQQTQTADDPEEDEDQSALESPAPGPPAADLPKLDLTGPMLYQFLLAEVALQRGNAGLAAQAYSDLAKKTRDPRVARRATEIALYARMGSVATDSARIWLETEPESAQARQTLTGLLISSNNLEEALPHLRILLSAGGRSPAEAYLQLNRLLSSNQDKKATLGAVKSLTADHPELPEAHFAVAQAALNAEDDALALSEIRAATKLRPDWEAAVLVEGQILQKTSIPAARERWEEYLKINPKAREARMSYARALVAEQRYPEARAEFRRLLADFPDNTDVVFAVGLLSFQLNDYAEAKANLQRLLGMNFRDRNAVRLYLGQIAEEEKNYPEALRWYDEVGRGEQYLGAQIRHAQVLAKQGNLDAARAYLRQLNVNGDQARVQLILAEAGLLRDANRAAEAFELLNRALVEQPENPDLLYDQAMLGEKINRMDVLEANLRKLIAMQPDHAHAYNALGYSLADRNQRLQEARQLIEKALALSPNDAFIIDSMGWVLYRQGDNKQAIEFLRRAFNARQDAEIAAHLGEVLWTSGQRAEAEKIWQAAMKKSPENEALSSTIRRFKP